MANIWIIGRVITTNHKVWRLMDDGPMIGLESMDPKRRIRATAFCTPLFETAPQ